MGQDVPNLSLEWAKHSARFRVVIYSLVWAIFGPDWTVNLSAEQEKVSL